MRRAIYVFVASTLLFAGAEANEANSAESVLPAEIRSILDRRDLPHESLSLHIADVDSGETLLSWRENALQNPASTIKLLTTLVALDELGPAYRWKTEVYRTGKLYGNLLHGDLVLKGYGDPFLVSQNIWRMLKDVRNAGVHDITGNLLIDDSWFRVESQDPGAFDGQPLRAYNVEPNALMMNFKVVRFWIEPEREAGSVKVWTDPALDNLEIDNRLRLVDSSCRGYQRGVAINADPRSHEVTLSGRFPDGCRRYALDRAVLSHNEFSFGLFRTLWRELGGTFDGEWKNTTVPEGAVRLTSFASPSLGEIIARVNKHSNNVMARHLLYTLAAERHGVPGTEEGGKNIVDQWLAEKDLASNPVILENGAGLSRESRISAKDMGSMLYYAWRQPYMPEYLASMSLSGLDGTLRKRLGGGGLAGKAHLKTGSLDHVAAIAGYLQSRSGRRFTVTTLQNHTDVHRGPGEEVQEAVLRWLDKQ